MLGMTEEKQTEGVLKVGNTVTFVLPDGKRSITTVMTGVEMGDDGRPIISTDNLRWCEDTKTQTKWAELKNPETGEWEKVEPEPYEGETS
jgi:hypothetical protein